MEDFATINAIYEKFFGNHRPARSVVEVARLPKDVLFEIECIARCAFDFIYTANSRITLTESQPEGVGRHYNISNRFLYRERSPVGWSKQHPKRMNIFQGLSADYFLMNQQMHRITLPPEEHLNPSLYFITPN